MLSQKTKYAIVALVRLAREFGNGPVPIGRIAGDEHIPQHFLEGILLELKKGGVLESVRGKTGGYFLSRDPGEVSLRDVIVRFESKLGMLSCACEEAPHPCQFRKDEQQCKIRGVFTVAHRAVSELLGKTTLRDLV